MARKPGRWDKGTPYEYLKLRITEMYNSLLKQWELSFKINEKKLARNLINTTVALIQLRNGLRASESIEATEKFVKDGKRKFEIQAKKHGDTRWVIIPNIIVYPSTKEAWQVAEGTTINSYKKFVKRRIGVNTHTLRYALVRYMLQKGYKADIISIVLGHKKIDTTYHYERSFNAIEVLTQVDDI